MVRQGIGARAMVVVTGHIVKQAPHMFAPRLIDGDERLAPTPAMRFRLLEHDPDAAAIDRVLPPGGLREKP